MKRVLFIAIALLVSIPLVKAQETEGKKDVKVKVEKKFLKGEGEDEAKSETRVIVIDNGEVIVEQAGEDIDVDEVLAKAGISEAEIMDIEVNIESELEGKKMLWVTKDGDNTEFEINEDANVFVIKDKDGKVHKHKFNKPNKHAMFSGSLNNVGIYDYSKSDKETKDFNVKQKKEIKFSNINISAINGGILLSFESDEKDVTVKLFDSNGKKLFYEMSNDYGGKYSSFIPVEGEKGSVYLLEVSSDDKNYLQKVKID